MSIFYASVHWSESQTHNADQRLVCWSRPWPLSHLLFQFSASRNPWNLMKLVDFVHFSPMLSPTMRLNVTKIVMHPCCNKEFHSKDSSCYQSQRLMRWRTEFLWWTDKHQVRTVWVERLTGSPPASLTLFVVRTCSHCDVLFWAHCAISSDGGEWLQLRKGAEISTAHLSQLQINRWNTVGITGWALWLPRCPLRLRTEGMKKKFWMHSGKIGFM